MFEFEFCQANKSSSSLSSSDSGELSRVNLLMRLRLSCSSLMWLSLGVSKMSKSCEDLLSSLSAGRSFTPCLIILRMLSMGFTERERKYQYMSNVKLCTVNQVFYNHDNPWFIIFITISCLSHSTAQWIKHQTITYMYSIEPSYIL